MGAKKCTLLYSKRDKSIVLITHRDALRTGHSRERGRLRAPQRGTRPGDVLHRQHSLAGATLVDQRAVAAAVLVQLLGHGSGSGGADQAERLVDPLDLERRGESPRDQRQQASEAQGRHTAAPQSDLVRAVHRPRPERERRADRPRLRRADDQHVLRAFVHLADGHAVGAAAAASHPSDILAAVAGALRQPAVLGRVPDVRAGHCDMEPQEVQATADSGARGPHYPGVPSLVLAILLGQQSDLSVGYEQLAVVVISRPLPITHVH